MHELTNKSCVSICWCVGVVCYLVAMIEVACVEFVWSNYCACVFVPLCCVKRDVAERVCGGCVVGCV